MERALVTGGAGFVGSHLAEALVGRGYGVVILDDLSTGKEANIASLLQVGRVDFVKGTVGNLPLLKKLCRGARYVFHLAAIPSVPRSMKKPRDSHRVNATGTLNVLLAARDGGVSKVVMASSSSVYGDTPTLPKREDMLPNPQSPYAASKLAAENYCHVFDRAYGLPTVCLRYFNVYGPRQDPGSQYAAVIPRFISRVVAGMPPVIFGDGQQTRDFTYVADVVQANLLAAESDATGCFNIGSGERTTINRLAGLVISLTGNSVSPVYEPARPGDIEHSLADISLAGGFGYRPGFNLETGLARAVEGLLK